MADPTRRDPTKRFSRMYTEGGAATRTVSLPPRNELPPPPPPAGFVFTPTEQELFDDLWATAESTQWQDSDILPTAVLVKLMSKVNAGEATAPMLAEMRQLMTALGLTPAGRQRQGWEVRASE